MVKKKILVVDDELFIRDILKSILEEEYEVIEAGDGEEGLDLVKKERPDLVILDYKMPKKTGIEVCRELREDPLFLHIPIIMLTGKGEVKDKVEGLEVGADDYIVKPFESQELLARVKMVLKRSERDLDANPLTRLPGNVSIMNEIQKRLDSGEKFAVLYLDLNKFKAFNDYYGFKRGDELIKTTARLIIEAVHNKGTEDDFIGHIGGDDFVVVTQPDKAQDIAKEIIERFDSQVPLLYDEEDRKRGFIISKDRLGREKKFSIVSIAMGIVTNLYRDFQHIGEVSSVGAELKNFAKSFGKSIYVEEKRKTDF
ncbi:MAG TPA: diguanylate cyclase [Candidatus Omnitrophica bacterium]|nr:MAG: diguanylate cyclase response regulator [Candidatus Omnitrophota bacterium]RKY43877.1 MAG: diguanylate cyclase response regulator [Candidatus Omnitrophota bacterium]HEC70027.1 diguanylate cyclase [Candidatus Omnitrophota bacterium]